MIYLDPNTPKFNMWMMIIGMITVIVLTICFS
jgi:hypothetical protein